MIGWRSSSSDAEFPNVEVRILSNNRRITPVSLNMGLRDSRGTVIIRVDGHCEIEPGYVRRCCEVLQATGYENVGGSCVTEGETAMARAIAAAQSSQFGVGNVAFRVGRAEPGAVDTVPFGAWPRRVFDEVGAFDEDLVRNQDDEHNFRIIQSGGTVWFDPAIRSRYFSRSSLRKLARQYFQYGSYKVRVMQKRGGVASPRHLVPAAFVASVAASILLARVTRRSSWAAVVLGPYAVANAVATARVSRADAVDPLTTSAAFAVLHTCYGAGTLHGIWRWRAHFRAAHSR